MNEEVLQGSFENTIAVDHLDTIALSQELALEEKVNLNAGSVKLSRKRKEAKTENTELTFSAAKVMKDVLTAEPIVGFENYTKVLQQNNTITKEDLFMHGIKEGSIVRLSFSLDGVGNPIDIVVDQFSDGPIRKAIIKQISSSGLGKGGQTNVSFTVSL